MIERCPRCREPLLSLGWSMLEECEPCGGYVEPDGAWVERREGRIRYADAMTRDAPRTLAELAEAIDAPPETFRDDLAELCARHRRVHRGAFETSHEWLTVNVVGQGDRGYREGSEAPLQRVDISQPRTAPTAARALLGVMGLGAAMIGVGLLPLPNGIAGVLFQVGVLFAIFPVMIAVVAGVGYLVGRLFSPGPRVQRIERRRESPRLTVRTTDGATHELLASETRVRLTETADRQAVPLFAAWLEGPGLRSRLVASERRDAVRSFVLRLEYLLGLDSLPPR